MHIQPDNQPERDSSGTDNHPLPKPHQHISQELLSHSCDLLTTLLHLQHDIRTQLPAAAHSFPGNDVSFDGTLEAAAEKAEALLSRASQGIGTHSASDYFQEAKILAETIVHFTREAFSAATQSILNDAGLLSRCTALAEQAQAELCQEYGDSCVRALKQLVEDSGYYHRAHKQNPLSSGQDQALELLLGDPSKLSPDSLLIRKHATAIGSACNIQDVKESIFYLSAPQILEEALPAYNHLRSIAVLVAEDGWEMEKSTVSPLLSDMHNFVSACSPSYMKSSSQDRTVSLSFAECLALNNSLMAPALQERFGKIPILRLVNFIRQGCLAIGQRNPLSEASLVDPTTIEKSINTASDLPMTLASEIGPEAIAVVSRLRQDPDFSVAVAPYWWCLDVLQDLIAGYANAASLLFHPEVIAAADRSFIATLMGPHASVDPETDGTVPSWCKPIRNSSVPIVGNPHLWVLDLAISMSPGCHSFYETRREIFKLIFNQYQELPTEISRVLGQWVDSSKKEILKALGSELGSEFVFPARTRSEDFYRAINRPLEALPSDVGLAITLHPRYWLIASQFPDYVDDALAFLGRIDAAIPLAEGVSQLALDEALLGVHLLVHDAFLDKRSLRDARSWNDTPDQLSQAFRMYLLLDNLITERHSAPLRAWSSQILFSRFFWNDLFLQCSLWEFGKIDFLDPEALTGQHRIPHSYRTARDIIEPAVPSGVTDFPRDKLTGFFCLAELIVGRDDVARHAEDIGLALYHFICGEVPKRNYPGYLTLPDRFYEAVLADTRAASDSSNRHGPVTEQFNYLKWQNRLPFSSLSRLFILSATTFEDGNSSDAPFMHMFSGSSEMPPGWWEPNQRTPKLLASPEANKKLLEFQNGIFSQVATIPQLFEPLDPLDLMLFARAVSLDVPSSALQRPLLRTIKRFDQDLRDGALACLSKRWEPAIVQIPRAVALSETATTAEISTTYKKRLREIEIFREVNHKRSRNQRLTEEESQFIQTPLFTFFNEASSDVLYDNKISSIVSPDDGVRSWTRARLSTKETGNPKPVNRLEFLRLTELLCDLCNGGKSNNVTCVQNPEFLAQIQHLLELDSLIKAVEEEFKRHELKSGSSSLEVAFRPTRGILSEFVGDICDTCISRVPRLAATHPDLTFVPFVKNPSFTGKNGQVPRLAGGSLVLNTEVRNSDGTTERALMIRGFNPAPSLFKSIRAQEIFEAFADYLVPIAQALGAKKIVAPQEVGWGLSLTNRPYVFLHVRNQYYSDRASERLQLARPEEAMVNNILVKSVVTIRAVPQTQSEKRNS